MIRKSVNAQAKPFEQFHFFEFCTETFPSLLSQHIEFEQRPETNNLRPHVYQHYCAELALPSAESIRFETEVRQLVARRNSIAHGEKNYIRTVQQYTVYERATTIVMHELAVAVLHLLELRDYRSLVEFEI